MKRVLLSKLVLFTSIKIVSGRGCLWSLSNKVTKISFLSFGKRNQKSSKKRKLNQDGKITTAQFPFFGSWNHLTLTLHYQNEARKPLEDLFKQKKEYSQQLRGKSNHGNPITNSHENIISIQSCICIKGIYDVDSRFFHSFNPLS